LAVVYLRQSTARQVEQNTGSTAHQRNQETYARQWGWPESRIEVIDEDLGLSGTSTEHRTGWKRLQKLVSEEKVGAIFTAEVSRLNRSRRDFGTLVELCRDFNTLLVVDGAVVDFDDSTDRFMTNIRADVAEYDNDLRKQAFAKATWAKARQGHAVSGPPTGYVVDRPGQWRKDPDLRVREMIAQVFEDYERLGSLNKVLKFYYEHGIRLPARRGAEVQWQRPYHNRIYLFLTNPVYKGDYVFGRYHFGRGGRRQAGPDKMIVIPGHHDPYVSPERWARIQARLRGGRVMLRQPAGKGAALCQGILRCGRCKRHMTVHYNPRRTGLPFNYRCDMGKIVFGQPVCWTVNGNRLDEVVVAELLQSLRPPELEAVLAAAADVNAGYQAVLRQREAELVTARGKVEGLKRHLDAVAPENRLVHLGLQQDLEGAYERLAAVERTQREHPPSPPLVPTPEKIAAIHRLAQDLPALWGDPSTTHEDRKRLLRLLIHEVQVTSSDPMTFTIAIHWIGGAVTESTLFHPYGSTRLARELKQQGWSLDEIVEELNRRGARTPYNRRQFSRENLGAIFYRDARGLRSKSVAPWDGRQEELRPLLAELLAAGYPHKAIAAELQRREVPNITPTRPWNAGQVMYLRSTWKISVPRLRASRREALYKILPELVALRDDMAIARELERRGVLTVRFGGRAWTAPMVAYALSRLKIRLAPGPCQTAPSSPDCEPEAA
jgi:DNA invertase Pin-like site-specific DNA recombinase